MSCIKRVPEPDMVITHDNKIGVALMSQMIFLNWKEIKSQKEFLQSEDF